LAPGEGDVEIARISKRRPGWVFFSKDSDLVGGYALPTVIRAVADDKFKVYHTNTIITSLKISKQQMITMFILLSNDYGPNIPQFGPVKTLALVQGFTNKKPIIEVLNAIFTDEFIINSCQEKFVL
jgi:5'-3' exonuclease